MLISMVNRERRPGCGHAAAQDADCDTGKDSGPVDEHVADFIRPARDQLLTKFQGYPQKYHGEGRQDGARPLFDGEKRQKGQACVGAEMQHFLADGQPSDGAHYG